jgi:purine-binding chemotaxis protein CheW
MNAATVTGRDPAATARPAAAGGGNVVALDAARRGEFLTFALDHEIFAIEVDRVREVVDPIPVTEVPNAPGFAPGVVNVRGNVVPLVDLRRKFGMPPPASEGELRIVVAEVSVEGEPTLVGIKADAVYEVVDTGRAEIDDLPRLGTRWRPEFIRGVVKQETGFVIILDIGRILSGADAAPRPYGKD